MPSASADQQTADGPPAAAPHAPVVAPTADDLIEAGHRAERAGNRQEARTQFEAALHSLRVPDAGSKAAAAMRAIARTYMMDANPDAATDCAQAAFAVALACGDRVAEGHAINLQAAIHWSQGELDTAESLYLIARTTALSAGERSLVAMTSANLGIVAAVRGDVWEALHHFNVGLEQYRAMDRAQDVSTALNNIGRLLTDLRRWRDAEQAYTEAIEIANAIGDRSARLGLEVNVAELWLARGDAARAVTAVESAARLSAETGDAAWDGHIAKLRGILRRDAGAANEAELHFARAAEVAELRQDPLLLAETLRESAELYQRQGRNRQTLQNLNRAHRIFTQLRAKRELANVDQSVARLEGDFIRVVERWGQSIEAKDHYTQGHCVRVADLSCAIAQASGVEAQTLFWFRVGALLHDVGKLVVPPEILNKPGKLTEDEWALMKSHPSAGVDMLAGIDFPWDVRPIVEFHHERWDGRGYPHGLAGEDIPLSARILAVADVYDALTSTRSYKPAMDHDAAMRIMRAGAGSAFDPGVFDQFETVMRDGRIPDAAKLIGTIDPRRDHFERPQSAADVDGTVALATRQSFERIASRALADRRTTRGGLSLLVFELEAGSARAPREADAGRWARCVARQLLDSTRASDFVARTAECQIMALLPGAREADAANAMRRVRSALTRCVRRGDVGAANHVRMAAVTAPRDGDTLASLMASAERAARRQTPRASLAG